MKTMLMCLIHSLSHIYFSYLYLHALVITKVFIAKLKALKLINVQGFCLVTIS